MNFIRKMMAFAIALTIIGFYSCSDDIISIEEDIFSGDNSLFESPLDINLEMNVSSTASCEEVEEPTTSIVAISDTELEVTVSGEGFADVTFIVAIPDSIAGDTTGTAYTFSYDVSLSPAAEPISVGPEGATITDTYMNCTLIENEDGTIDTLIEELEYTLDIPPGAFSDSTEVTINPITSNVGGSYVFDEDTTSTTILSFDISTEDDTPIAEPLTLIFEVPMTDDTLGTVAPAVVQIGELSEEGGEVELAEPEDEEEEIEVLASTETMEFSNCDCADTQTFDFNGSTITLNKCDAATATLKIYTDLFGNETRRTVVVVPSACSTSSLCHQGGNC